MRKVRKALDYSPAVYELVMNIFGRTKAEELF